MSFELRGRTVAVLGGDAREVEIVRLAVQAGASVRTCGVLPAGAAASGQPAAATVAEAVQGAELIICPAPYPQADGSIFAEEWHETLYVDKESLRGVAPGAILMTSRASAAMREAAEVLGLRLVEYDHEVDLKVLRAPAVAEGAIKIAIEQTSVTLHQNPCLVIGFGYTGTALAQALRGLGARVTVAARSPVQRAAAYAMGCEAVEFERVAELAPQMAAIFNTAPTPVLTRAVLERLSGEQAIIDTSGPPGGTDWEAAKELGRKVIWARGMPRFAPKTVGTVQWQIILRLLDRF